MIVSADNFNMEEFLGYTKIFLREAFKEENIELIEGTYEDFEGTNKHAGILQALEKKITEEYGKKKN